MTGKTLDNYYEDELSFIREMGKEFAERHPNIAAELKLERDRAADDPHVERLLQGFALLTARVQKQLDDQFPQLTEAFFHVLYPHYLRPVPSMSVIEFQLDPDQGKVTSGLHLPAGSTKVSKRVDGRACEFRTAYPVTLWPLEVTSGSIGRPSGLGTAAGDAVAAIRIELRPQGAVKLPELQLQQLRFFLRGEDKLTFPLYELLFNSTARVVLRSLPSGKTVILPASALRPVGFGRDEGILPYDDRSFLGYRLLQEYFSFPWKFLFFDVEGFHRLEIGPKDDRLEIAILLDAFERPERLPDLERDTTAETFRLGCSPVVNLFDRLSEPITLSHHVAQYWVNPDQHNPLTTEVYSVDRVVSLPPSGQALKVFEPFYSIRHSYGKASSPAFWYATQRPSSRANDLASEVYLSFVDLDFRPDLPAGEVVHAEITCTNRDLPGSNAFKYSGAWGEFESPAAAGLRARALIRPTSTLRPPIGGAHQWRLISHLSLNHLSITGSLDALKEILSLYDFSNAVRTQVSGLTALKAQRVMERVSGPHGVVFGQGLRIDLEVDEESFRGSGCYPFLCVLDHFFGLYTALNSFTRLQVKSLQRREDFRRWNSRAGEQILL